MLGYLPRVEIRGGAGSGKTWLAVEKARRLAAEGKRVALMCYSRGLAEFLKRRVGDAAPKRAAGLRRHVPLPRHRLGRRAGFGRRQPRTGRSSCRRRWCRWPQALPEAERFDAIVIDEAQDFAESWWSAVLAALRDPENGCLYVFADEGQRVFARQGRPTVDLVPIPLNENLRNTKQIAGTFSSLAPAQMQIRGRHGVPVRFVQCASEDAVDAADDDADALLDERLAARGRRAADDRTAGIRCRPSGRPAGQDAYWASFWDERRPVLRARPRASRGSSGRPSSWPSTASATRRAPGRCSTSACPGPATCSSSAATWS